MNKLKLISTLKTEANVSKVEAAKVVQIFFDSMGDAMANAKAVVLLPMPSNPVKSRAWGIFPLMRSALRILMGCFCPSIVSNPGTGLMVYAFLELFSGFEER